MKKKREMNKDKKFFKEKSFCCKPNNNNFVPELN